MPASWKDFESHVRHLANYIWNRSAEPDRIGGVDIDCVITISPTYFILIEITEERSLAKVREDVLKLETARNALWAGKKIGSRCFCVVNGPVTQGMKDAGTEPKIEVVSIARFEKLFFDFESYKTARLKKPFGSTVNPLTGAQDESKYVPVSYTLESSGKDIQLEGIADLVRSGKKVILLGEYGSGKSRCMKELFLMLSPAAEEKGNYPIAIDLRDNWGLTRGAEIIRRHLGDLGLDNLANSVIKTFGGDSFCYLMDGFDEVGSQAWSDDQVKLRNIRAQSLAGVKDLIAQCSGGLIICGREHYFNNTAEMFELLGLGGGVKQSFLDQS